MKREPTSAERRMWDDFLDKYPNTGINIDACTCLGCESASDCPCAYDLYNTSGDCLAGK